jgi:hypothetical protein
VTWLWSLIRLELTVFDLLTGLDPIDCEVLVVMPLFDPKELLLVGPVLLLRSFDLKGLVLLLPPLLPPLLPLVIDLKGPWAILLQPRPKSQQQAQRPTLQQPRQPPPLRLLLLRLLLTIGLFPLLAGPGL